MGGKESKPAAPAPKPATVVPAPNALMEAVAAGKPVTQQLRALAGQAMERGMTALMFAAKANNAQAARQLLRAERGRQDANGWSALMYAASRDAAECVQLLVRDEAGLQTQKGQTALWIAINHNCRRAAQLLLQVEVGIQALEELEDAPRMERWRLPWVAEMMRVQAVLPLQERVWACPRHSAEYAALQARLKAQVAWRREIAGVRGFGPLVWAAQEARREVAARVQMPNAQHVAASGALQLAAARAADKLDQAGGLLHRGALLFQQVFDEPQ